MRGGVESAGLGSSGSGVLGKTYPYESKAACSSREIAKAILKGVWAKAFGEFGRWRLSKLAAGEVIGLCHTMATQSSLKQ